METILQILREFSSSLQGTQKEMANTIIKYVDYNLVSNWCECTIDKIIAVSPDKKTGTTANGRSIKAKSFNGQLAVGIEVFGYSNSTCFKRACPLTLDIVQELKGRIIGNFEDNIITNLEIGA